MRMKKSTCKQSKNKNIIIINYQIMKGIIKLFPVAVAVLALASCAEDDVLGGKTAGLSGNKTMVASIENYEPITRSAFAEIDSKASTRKMVWVENDEFLQYGENEAGDAYILSAGGAGKASADFELKGNPADYNDNPDIAIYPNNGSNNVSRDKSTLKMTLNPFNYDEIDANIEGYTKASVCPAPMIGIYNASKGGVDFTYLTALLKVDLKMLPKHTSALRIVTDRPLSGEFTVALDYDKTNKKFNATPEIVSPAGNGSTYQLLINTADADKRTDKIFYVPVPTGDKYKQFDISVLYTQGGATKEQVIAQIGNTIREAAGKTAIDWQRGKVRALKTEVKITSGGNTPALLSQFLEENKSDFSAGAEVTLTVTDASGNDDNLVADGADVTANGKTYKKNVLTIPTYYVENGIDINVLVPEGKNLGLTSLTINEEDPSTASKVAKNTLTITGNSYSDGALALTITLPETEVVLEEGLTAACQANAFGAITMNQISLDGLVVAADQKTGAITYATASKGGGLVVEQGATVGNITKYGAGNIVINGTAGTVALNGTGAISVEGQNDANGTLVKAVVGKITTGADAGNVTIKNATDINIDNSTNAAEGKAISIENVAKLDCYAGAAGSLAVKTVSELGIVSSTTKTKVTFDGITGVQASNAISIGATTGTNTGGLEIKNVTGNIALKSVTYYGSGDVSITGLVKSNAYPTLTKVIVNQDATDLHFSSKVNLKDIILTSLDKYSDGALTISDLRGAATVAHNYGGAISISGAAGNYQNTVALTQEGKGDITLAGLSIPTGDATPGQTTITLTGASAEVSKIDYANTAIASITATAATKAQTVTVTGTGKSTILQDPSTSAMATASKTVFKFATEKWNGTDVATVASANIFTPAALAALRTTTATSVAAKLFVDLDLDSKAWNTTSGTNIVEGINNNVVSLVGYKTNGEASGTNTKADLRTIKNLNAPFGLFGPAAYAANARAARTVALTITDIKLDTPTITGTTKAGAFIGWAGEAVTMTNAQVSNGTIGGTSASTTAENIGGLVGLFDAAAKDIIITKSSVTGATINGHYFMGGLIGGIAAATNVTLGNWTTPDDNKNNVSTVTFNVLASTTSDGAYATDKSGTIASFIGGVTGDGTTNGIKTKLIIAKGQTVSLASQRESLKYKSNFLHDDAARVYFFGMNANRDYLGYVVPGSVKAFDFMDEGSLSKTGMTEWVGAGEPAAKISDDTYYNIYKAY